MVPSRIEDVFAVVAGGAEEDDAEARLGVQVAAGPLRREARGRGLGAPVDVVGLLAGGPHLHPAAVVGDGSLPFHAPAGDGGFGVHGGFIDEVAEALVEARCGLGGNGGERVPP